MASAGSVYAAQRGYEGGDRRPIIHPGVRHSVNRHAEQVAKHGRSRIAYVHVGLVPLANTAWDNPAMPPAVASAILAAASECDIDPQLLAALAWRESRFDPSARNHFSSAIGLLQFTNSTWLHALHTFGARHHLADYAARITKDASGTLDIADKRLRKTVMGLRTDPVLSTALAAEVIREQRQAMAIRLGRDVGLADLYLLHVLGTGGSSRFLAALANHPTASSQTVESRRVLRQAGLLARDGLPMTVANTFISVEHMLEDQRRHSEPLLAAAKPTAPLEFDQAP